MKKSYVQFYERSDFLFEEDRFHTNYRNGLSHVWDLLDGEIYWVEVNTKTPPVNYGEVYVSCWMMKDILTVINWAIHNQDIKFYICGPAIVYCDFKPQYVRLSNLNIIRGDAEDVFLNGQTNSWTIKDIPKDIGDIGYSVSITKGRGCYWSKCNFCTIKGRITYRKIDSIPIINHSGHKYIWIHTYAIPPKLLRKYYYQFEDRDDVDYATYIRAEKACTKAFQDVLANTKCDPKHFAFDLGIECPSNRMLQYFNKGITKEDYLDFISLATQVGCRLNLNLIFRLKNIIEEDVYEVEEWLNKLKKITDGSNVTANLYPLVVFNDRPIYNDYKDDHMVWLKDCIWDLPLGGQCILDEKTQALDDRIRNMYHQFPFRKLKEGCVLNGNIKEGNQYDYI